MQLARFGWLHSFAFLMAVGAVNAHQPTALRLVQTVNSDQLGIGRIWAITTDGRGTIYALETSPDAQGVVVIDSTGSIVTRFGRPGEGPGEFQGLANTLAWMGDTLLTFDRRASRLTGFDRAGKAVLLNSWPLTTPMPGRILSTARGPLGVYVGAVRVGPSTMVPRGQTQILERKHELRILRINRDGSGTVIPAITDTTHGVISTQCASMRSGDRPQVILPFKNLAPLLGASPAGEIVRGHLDRYQIDFLDVASGRILRSIRRDFRDRPVTSADLARTPEGARLVAAERESGGRLVGDPSTGRPCAIYDLIPKAGPPLRSVTVDESGRVWVESMDPVRQGVLLLHVFDATGNLAVETVMPERDMRVEPHVRGNRLYVVRADDLGAQSILVYQLGR